MYREEEWSIRGRNDLANSGETEQSFHGFGFIVDPGTKLARTWRKRATRASHPTCSPLLSFLRAEEPIALRSVDWNISRGDILIYGQDGVCPGRNNFDSRLCPVSREHILTLNKFLLARNSIVYFPLSKHSSRSREICRGYCTRKMDSFETI